MCEQQSGNFFFLLSVELRKGINLVSFSKSSCEFFLPYLLYIAIVSGSQVPLSQLCLHQMVDLIETKLISTDFIAKYLLFLLPSRCGPGDEKTENRFTDTFGVPSAYRF